MFLLIACAQPQPNDSDSGPETPVRSASASISVSSGDSKTVTDPDGAEGPGNVTDAGHIEQAIYDIRESLLGDHIEVTLEGTSAGVGPGDTCRDFDNQVDSVGGCDWFSLGSGELTSSGGDTLYTSGQWTEAGGTLEVTGLRTDDSGTYISFEFEMALVTANAEATVTGEVVDAWITP
ncbi:MAG TPA: hypothetical protein QGF58_24330 [Myxococcota bacterium]|nr:hypothetical protein [Myxococcota bacterium]